MLEMHSPDSLGFDAARLARVDAAIAHDVERGIYDGAALMVGRRGGVALDSVQGLRTARPSGCCGRTTCSSRFRRANSSR